MHFPQGSLYSTTPKPTTSHKFTKFVKEGHLEFGLCAAAFVYHGFCGTAWHGKSPGPGVPEKHGLL